MSEEGNEVEKVIPIEEKEDAVEVTAEEEKLSTINKKLVSELTDDEKALLISNARNGIKNDYFDVTFFKNGNTRIVKRKQVKPKKQTLARRIINNNNNNNPSAIDDSKIYMSNDQLMMEHIIELNTRVEKLSAKHKKLKKKYRSLKNDIYEDADDSSTVVEPDANNVNDEEVKEAQKEAQKEQQPAPTPTNTRSQCQPYITRLPQKGWRSMVKYL